MIINGYAKAYKYAGDGTLLVQVRIPTIHGPMKRNESRGNLLKQYTEDENLPYYESLLLPHLPAEGEVVTLMSRNERTTEFIVIGLTGGSYYNNLTNKAQPNLGGVT